MAFLKGCLRVVFDKNVAALLSVMKIFIDFILIQVASLTRVSFLAVSVTESDSLNGSNDYGMIFLWAVCYHGLAEF